MAVATIASALAVTSTITVGPEPTGITYDSGKSEIFVVCHTENSVYVILDSTNEVVSTVPVGTGPYKAVYDSGKGEVFVVNEGANSVSVISDSSNAVVATVPVGTQPSGAAYDSARGEVFVANLMNGTVSVISDNSNSVIATVHVGSGPINVAYDSGKGEIFVVNYVSNSVSIISDSSNTVIATAPVGTSPTYAAYDSGKGEVFVCNSGSNSVSVISDGSNTVTATVNVGTTPYGAAYDSATGQIFVANHEDNSVSVISDNTNAVIENVTVGTLPYGIAYDPGKGEIFVTNAGYNTVTVISDSSSALVSPSSTSMSAGTATPASTPTTQTTAPSSAPSTNPTATLTASPTQTAVPSSAQGLLQQVWVPQPVNAAVAVGVSAAVVGIVSIAFAVISNPLGEAGGKVGERTKGLIPDNIKEWLEEVVSSRRKLSLEEKAGSFFKPTKLEALAYVTAVIVLAVSFSYVKVITLNQIWEMLPVFFLTGVLVGFVQKFFSIAYLRSRGVWSEYKIWPLGLILFLFTTFAFKVPFSSPTRSVHQEEKLTERLGALASTSEILIALAFAGLFFLILELGYTAVGGAGLDMCVIGAFFGTFPIAPMSGRDIFKHSKSLWGALFVATLVVFAAWLFLI
jgi:YVTN family beta-propeller protein